MAIYVVEDIEEQKTLFTTESAARARKFADELHESTSKSKHFRVIKLEVVYVTCTLDELFAAEEAAASQSA